MAPSALDLLKSRSKRSAAVLDEDSEQDKAKSDAEACVRHYQSLVKRKAAADSTKKTGGAAWWQFFEVVLEKDSDTKSATGVKLQCIKCDALLSSSNPTRIAKSHIMSAGCKAIKQDAVLGQEVADALVKGKATAEAIDVDDDTALQQFQQSVAKSSAKQSSITTFGLNKSQGNLFRKAVATFFLEASDCIAMHAVDHPAFKKIFQLLNVAPVCRQASLSCMACKLSPLAWGIQMC